MYFILKTFIKDYFYLTFYGNYSIIIQKPFQKDWNLNIFGIFYTNTTIIPSFIDKFYQVFGLIWKISKAYVPYSILI